MFWSIPSVLSPFILVDLWCMRYFPVSRNNCAIQLKLVTVMSLRIDVESQIQVYHIPVPTAIPPVI